MVVEELSVWCKRGHRVSMATRLRESVQNAGDSSRNRGSRYRGQTVQLAGESLARTYQTDWPMPIGAWTCGSTSE